MERLVEFLHGMRGQAALPGEEAPSIAGVRLLLDIYTEPRDWDGIKR